MSFIRGSIEWWWRSAALGICALCLAGCAGRARLADDPFRRPSAGGGAPAGSTGFDPRYDSKSPDTFERANQSARQKDVSSNISTDPIDDRPKVAQTTSSEDDALRPASQREVDGDPLLGSNDRPAISRRPSEVDAFGSTTRVEGSDSIETYERVRERLERAGAKHWRFDKDAANGEIHFSCEVPYPGSSTKVRVFEASSGDELKAMLAVAEQVEKWVSTPR